MSSPSAQATSTKAGVAGTEAQKKQNSQSRSPGPRVNNASPNGTQKKSPNTQSHQNGHVKQDGQGSGRKQAHGSQGSNGGKKTGNGKPKSTNGVFVSEFLRGRGASNEIVQLVHQIRSELNNHFSEEEVYNTLVGNNNDGDRTRTALAQRKSNSWAAKAAPAAPAASSSQAAPAPAAQPQAQQPRAKKNKQNASEKKTAAAVVAAAPVVPAVDPVQMEKNLQSALQARQTETQELLELQSQVSSVRVSQTELNSEKEVLTKAIADREAANAADKERIKQIDASLAELHSSLAQLHSTIAKKTGAGKQ